MSSPEAPSTPAREAPARPPSIDAQGDHRTLHPDDVRGRFITGRRVVYALLIAVYLGVPFLTLGGHPVIHLDIPGRRFYLESARLPIFLTAERDRYHGPFEFQVVVKDRGSGEEKRITGRFLGPPR